MGVTLHLAAAAAPLPGSVSGGLEATANAAYGDVTNQGNLPTVVGQVIRVILGFVGTIFFILIIYGGLLWMTSAGDQDKVKKARGIIGTSAIGLGVVLAAFAITFFVYTALGGATGTALPPNPPGP
jgi:hypothetical protein